MGRGILNRAKTTTRKIKECAMVTTQEKILKPKLGLLELAKQLGDVSEACQIMGYSRDTFYRYQEPYPNGGRGETFRSIHSGSLFALVVLGNPPYGQTLGGPRFG